MASVSRIALVLLGLPFLSFAEDPVMKDVDMGKVAGKWYPVKTVGVRNGQKPIHAYTVEPMNDGSITLKFEIPENEACTVKKIVMAKTGPGVFSSAEGQVTVMDTDYDTYLFSHYVKGDINLLQLCARKKKVSKKIRKQFHEFVKRVGIKSPQRYKLQEKDMCKSPPVNA